MNLYFRTFSVLKPFWKQLVTASVSAALHGILTGLLIWMFGPLLMTLFQVDSIPVVSALGDVSHMEHKGYIESLTVFNDPVRLVVEDLRAASVALP